MHTLNEKGPQAGRFLYRTHEVGSNGAVSATDLWTGETTVLAQRAEWSRLDGIVWTSWGTLLIAEERTGGLVYEIDPHSGAATARPAIGRKSHEGMRFDPQGNLYSISETNPGYIFKFVPHVQGDLSDGQSYALRIVAPTGDRTGEAQWVALNQADVEVNADNAATAAGATGYNRPEDVEISTSSGNNRGGANTLYVAITGPGDNGNLYIAEDPATAPTTGRGDDIWVAVPARSRGSQIMPSFPV